MVNMNLHVMDKFTWKTTATISLLGLKVMPRMTVKAEIARTSSILDAAITRVGIPFAMP